MQKNQGRVCSSVSQTVNSAGEGGGGDGQKGKKGDPKTLRLVEGRRVSSYQSGVYGELKALCTSPQKGQKELQSNDD